MIKVKKIYLDIILNTIAYSLPILAKQIFVLPYLSQTMSAENYGLVIAIISLLNILPHLLGLTLNNIRLIYNKDKSNENLDGNFTYLVLCSCIVDVVFVVCSAKFYLNIGNVETLLSTIILSLVWLVREYYIVSFRLELNFKRVLVNNCLMFGGFLVGLIVYNYLKNWFVVYSIGYGISLIYVFSHTDLYKSKPKRTADFKKITKDSLILFLSNILDAGLNNFDKLLIYPILGGAAVSIYFASSVYTKIISLLVGPATSVILSYVAKGEKQSSKKFFGVLFLGCTIGIIGYIICVCIGEFVLSILYPDFVNEALKYIWLTSATAMLVVIRGMIRPYVLCFYKMSLQLTVAIVGAVSYIVIILLFINTYHIYAICSATLVAETVKLLLMVIVYILSFRKAENTNE